MAVMLSGVRGILWDMARRALGTLGTLSGQILGESSLSWMDNG